MPVSTDDVVEIYATILGTTSIQAMIDTADVLVQIHIDPVGDTRVTPELRDQIVKWLSAHFCAISDPETKEESADGVRTVFRGKTTMGLNFTSYGQQAMTIDPTGKLRNLAEGTKSLSYHLSSPRALTTDP